MGSCEIELGICSASGVYVCDGQTGRIYCNAPIINPLPEEICGNGLDDDCSGDIDNGCECSPGDSQGCYQGDIQTRGVGVCHDGIQTCPDGHFGACEQQGLPGTEICNGEDDDCDGNTDEGCPCSTGIGSCEQHGFIQLDGSCSVSGGQPQEEICGNNEDEDCTGAIDNGCECIHGQVEACYTGMAETRGIGACIEGSRSCVGGHWEDCGHQTLPSAEECNNVDDDCDGSADEGCPCSTGTGSCEAHGFIQDGGSCDATVGQPELETCNGRDDDCDGNTDEDFPGKNNYCSDGIGECFNEGVIICDPQNGSHCSVTAKPTNIEDCNNRDDDCDGNTDEGTGCPCAAGTGVCTDVGVILEDGSCSATAGQPGTETCNGRDDDCDGNTDEDLQNIGQPCEAGIGNCYRAGVMVCTLPQGAHCNATPGTPHDEICGNDADDDCEGTTDNGCPCSPGISECQRNGTIQLGGDCSAVAGDPTDEECNGLDDDCDGDTDEEFPGMGPCHAGLGVCRESAEYVCNPETGIVTCPAQAHPERATNEVCNGQDDDCDGR